MKKIKIIFASLLILSGFQVAAQTVFTHNTASSNIGGHITTIDNAATNENANKLLFVTQVYSGKYNNEPFGVWYNNGKWTIYQENKTKLEGAETYNVLAVDASNSAFMHKATPQNIVNNWTTIDHQSCNNNPNAVILVTQNWKGTYNPKSIGVWYNNGKWTIYNQDKSAIPTGANFNVLVLPKGSTNISGGKASIFMATTTTKKNKYGEHLANLPLANNSAKIFVTQNYGERGPYNAHESAVWFDAKNWTIYNKDKDVLPANTQFNILAIGATELLATDEAIVEIEAKPSKPTSGYVKFFNESGYVAKFTMTYTFKGENIKTETGDLALGARKTVTIPNEATNIKIKGEGSAVFSWTEIFNESFNSPPNKCFKVYATIFDPEWNNNCD